MLILAIDTSTHCGGVAIMKDEILTASLTLNIRKTHSERLLQNIDYLLSECGLQPSDLDGLAVSVGPGSFTGVRIGLSCAKGFCTAAKIPIIGISTLDSLALRCAEPNILICPVMDARRSEIFGAGYRLKDPASYELEEIIPGRALALEDFLKEIKEPALFTGDGSIMFKDIIKSALSKNARFAPPGRNLPSAVETALLGIRKLKKGIRDDPASISPLYLRSPDCRKPKPSI